MRKNWLKEYRISKNLTRQQVGDQIGVRSHYIYMLESGRRTPSVETAQKLGKLLDFHWTRFFE